MPLTPAQFRATLAKRFAETAAEDDRAAEEARAKLPEAVRLIVAALGPRRITLYGSLTKGFFRAPHSDIVRQAIDKGTVLFEPG